jgi:hypothetical protein
LLFRVSASTQRQRRYHLRALHSPPDRLDATWPTSRSVVSLHILRAPELPYRDRLGLVASAVAVRIWLICAQACCAAPEWRSRDRSASTAAGILCSGSRPKPTSRPYCGLGPRCSGDSREMLMPWAAAALARVTSSVSAASARSSCIPRSGAEDLQPGELRCQRARRGRGGAGRRSGQRRCAARSHRMPGADESELVEGRGPRVGCGLACH